MRTCTLLYLALLFLLSGCGNGFSKFSRPNVIFIMADTLRADYLGSYGFRGNISPNIDTFAKDAVLFTKCYSPSSWTKPSIASLFTSLYPSAHGVINPRWPPDVDHPVTENPFYTEVLSGEATTLAEAFKESGYQTTAIINNYWLHENYGFAQGFDNYLMDHQTETTKPSIFPHVYKWIEQSRKEEPFFLYLHFMDPHGWYVFEEKDYNEIKTSPDLGKDRKLTKKEYSYIPDYLDLTWEPHAGLPKPDRLLPWKASYGAGVKLFDRKLSKLLQTFEEEGLFENTIVIFTSDHGEQFLEHGDWHHGHSLFVEETHVPLIIRYPDKKWGGKIIENPISLVDLMPTLVKQCRLSTQIPYPLQGIDLSGLIEKKKMERNYVYAEGIKSSPLSGTIFDEKYQFVLDKEKGAFLFDLGKDPDGIQNVIKDLPDVHDKMRQRFQAQKEKIINSKTFHKESVPIDPDGVEALRSLGYL